jgi:hypothetical protein
MNTIEMIQQLGHGMKARSTNWGIEVAYDSGDILVTKNDDGTRAMSRKPLPLTNLVLNQMEWKISPQQISVNTALNCLKECNNVTVLNNGRVYVKSSLDDMTTLDNVLNGKWFRGAFNLEDLTEFMEESK